MINVLDPKYLVDLQNKFFLIYNFGKLIQLNYRNKSKYLDFLITLYC